MLALLSDSLDGIECREDLSAKLLVLLRFSAQDFQSLQESSYQVLE